MLDEADERWISGHGYDAENPLLNEVSEAVALLRAAPELRVSYHQERFRRGLRRLLLRSGWHLYYSYDQSRSVIVIVAVWFAARGTGPSV